MVNMATRTISLLASKVSVPAVVMAVFLWRTFYGLGQDFWHEDVVQIYLLGLKFYTTGLWPYFGPDVVHTQQQIAGGLQSLLIAIPLWFAPYAESPIVFANFLSVFGILLLSYFLWRSFPARSFLFYLFWLSTLPLTLQFSTNTYNPSYLLLPACIFFVGFFEAIPHWRRLQWPAWLAGAAMGFGISYIVQLHLSWPILAPFVIWGLLATNSKLKRTQRVLGFVLGAMLPAATLLPTVLEYGLSVIWAPGSANSSWNWTGIVQMPTTLLRFLSMSTYDFMGFNLSASIKDRQSLILSQWPLAICATVMTLGLIWQIGLQLMALLRGTKWRGPSLSESQLLLASLLWVALLFCFTSRPAATRNFYLLFPVLAYVMAALTAKLQPKTWGWRAMVILAVSSLIFHSYVSLLLWQDISLYRDRGRVQQAIDARDFRLLGERRPGIY